MIKCKCGNIPRMYFDGYAYKITCETEDCAQLPVSAKTEESVIIKWERKMNNEQYYNL